MKIFRPILSLILVLATTVLVSCSGPSASAPPTYTPDKLQRIGTYNIPIDVARQRIPELGEYLDNEDWVNADSFLHGPLGLIRRDLTYLSKALLPDEQEPALEVAKDIFNHIESIDAAVDEKNYTVAIREYKEMVSDFDTYSSLIPQAAKPEKQAVKPVESTETSVEAVATEVEEETAEEI